MNELKYQITQIVFLILLGLGGYWALTSLDSGVTYTRDQIIEDQIAQVTPDEQVNAVNNETVLVVEEEPEIEAEEEPVKTPEPVTNKNQDLIDDLQELIDEKVTMNSGANGKRVGTIQKFLDVYFTNKTVSIDNDFGPTTKGLVKDFQTAELNGGDGRVGPNTMQAMIEHLEG